MSGRTRVDTVPSRFWRHVVVGPGCWLWSGGRNRSGYGMLNVAGIPRLAHRIAWELRHGPIPHGRLVLHKCDVAPCVRPEHLYLGSQADNVRDMIERGRARLGRTAKLAPGDIPQIREWAASGLRRSAIAARLGVHPSSISRILCGRAWTRTK